MTELPLVLQLDQAGNPNKWINYEQSCIYYAKDLVAWSASPVEFDLHGGTCAATGEQSILTINTIIAIRGKVGAKQYASIKRVPLENKTMFRRDHKMCAYCGHTYTESRLTRDHVIPLSRNGANKWTNVVTACSPCNKIKDDKTPQEARMQLIYVPYEPNRAEYLILKNRRILADQMKFLLKRITYKSRVHLN